ncbi:MAG: Gfo/Idh/MocA family protein [Lachnospiraceae bacterium]
MELRYGIIGGGNGAFIGDVHRRGAFLGGLARLTAGCFTRNYEKNMQTAEEWNVEDKSRVYQSYAEMAEKESRRKDGIDFVSITTPNDTHYEIAKTFLQKGIHIMCDKPLTLTQREAYDLEKIAAERNLCFGLTYSYAGYAMVRQVREMVEHGKIGDIVHVTTEYPQDWLLLGLKENKPMWRMDPERGAGSLCTADIGTHLEHLVTAATGLEVREVLARFDYTPEGIPLETNSTVLLKFDGGISGTLWSSIVAIGHDADVRIRIYGTQGSLEWYHGTAGLLKYSRLGEPVQIYSMNRSYNYNGSLSMSHLPAGHPEGYYEAFGNIYHEFCREILDKKAGTEKSGYFYPKVHDGIQGVKFIDACVESHAKGNIWVSL